MHLMIEKIVFDDSNENPMIEKSQRFYLSNHCLNKFEGILQYNSQYDLQYNVQNKGGGGGKAVWTMLKETDNLVREVVPKIDLHLQSNWEWNSCASLLTPCGPPCIGRAAFPWNYQGMAFVRFLHCSPGFLNTIRYLICNTCCNTRDKLHVCCLVFPDNRFQGICFGFCSCPVRCFHFWIFKSNNALENAFFC